MVDIKKKVMKISLAVATIAIVCNLPTFERIYDKVEFHHRQSSREYERKRRIEEEVLKNSELCRKQRSAYQRMLSASQYSMVVFSTGWCGYCKHLDADLPKLHTKFPTVQILEIDAEKGEFATLDEQLYLEGWKMEGYPTILIYERGMVLGEYFGYDGERNTAYDGKKIPLEEVLKAVPQK